MVRFLSLLVLSLSFFASTSPAQEVVKQSDTGFFPPPHSLKRYGSTELRHGSRIQCLAYTPDGKIVAAGGGLDPIRFWVTKTGEQLGYTCSETSVQALLFHPRGRLLISGGAFKSIRIWDASTGKMSYKLDGHRTAVKALTISSDGILLISGSTDGEIRLWDLHSKRSVAQLKGHTEEVNGIALSDDSKYLASVSSDRTVIVWDLDKNNAQIHKLDGGCCVQAVAFGPNQTLYTAGDDAVIRQWDLKTGKELAKLTGHTDTITSLQYRKQEGTLVSGSRDRTVRFWKGNEKPTILTRDLGDTDGFALNEEGTFLASAGINNTVRIYQTDGLKEVPTLGPTAPLTSLVLSTDGKNLVTATTTGRVYPWNPATGQLKQPWDGAPDGSEITLAFTSNRNTLATIGRRVTLWEFWDLVSGSRKFDLPRTDGTAPLSARFSPNGKLLALGLRGLEAEIWDCQQKQLLQRIKHGSPVYTLDFNSTGDKLILSGGSKIAIHNIADGKLLSEFESKDGKGAPQVASILCSPDTKTLVAGCYDGAIRFYDLATGKLIRTCEGHVSVPYALTFSRDGRMLASGSFDRTVRIWEAFSTKPIITLTGHRGAITGLAFSPDDQILYSSSVDTSILSWDVTGRHDPEARTQASMNPAEIESAWLELASEDATQAHKALWRVVQAQKDAVPQLVKKVYLVDPAYVRKLFVDLDAEKYELRANAMSKIESYGRWMEGRLRTNLALAASMEARRRSEHLLERLETPGSLSIDQERMRLRRLMLVLEFIGDEASKKLFQDLTQRGPEEDLQEEAQISLTRLTSRDRAGS